MFLKKSSLYIFILFFLLHPLFAYSQQGTVDTTSESASNRIAPGEFLPVSVKLTNFGSKKRIDVTIDYKIFDATSRQVYSESETVAVETTAQFVKRVQLPYNLRGGFYQFSTILHYPYQEQPAISAFSFLVEEKIAGFFKSDFIFYSVLVILLILVTVFITHALVRYKRSYGIITYDYSNKPKHEIIYYEILSNIITQMRLHIGDDAIKIAKDIPDLKINDKNGLIIDIASDPAKIIALLVFRYESLLGRPLSFNVSPNWSSH